MLVLTRKVGEAIQIGSNVRVRVVATQAGQVRLAIEAPDEIRVHREEVYQRIAQANQEATRGDSEALRAWASSTGGSNNPDEV